MREGERAKEGIERGLHKMTKKKCQNLYCHACGEEMEVGGQASAHTHTNIKCATNKECLIKSSHKHTRAVTISGNPASSLTILIGGGLLDKVKIQRREDGGEGAITSTAPN